MHKVGIEDSSRTRAGVESGELAAESQTFARAERAGPSSCKCNRAERTAVIPVRWSLVRWVPSHRCDACGVHGAEPSSLGALASLWCLRRSWGMSLWTAGAYCWYHHQGSSQNKVWEVFQGTRYGLQNISKENFALRESVKKSKPITILHHARRRYFSWSTLELVIK